MKKKSKENEWRTHIANWQESGLTKHEWCRKNQMPFWKFDYWQRRIKLIDAQAAKPTNFIEIAPENPEEIEIQHFIIRFNGRQNMDQVLTCLKALRG